MKYFAVQLPMLDEKKSADYRESHLRYLEELTEIGHIFTYGRFVDGSGGLVIYQADDLETATNLAKNDPYVLNGARDYEIKEWAMNTDVVKR